MKFKDLNAENTEKKLYDKLMHMLSQKTYEDSIEFIDDLKRGITKI